MRNGLVGLGLGLVLAGVGAASGPQARPQVEGREPNPVSREFYEAEPPTFGYGSGPVASVEDAAPATGLRAAGVVWDWMLNELTVPLGTVPMWD